MKFLALAAVGTIAASACAQKHLQLAGSPLRAKPLFAQKVIKMYKENGVCRLVLGPKVTLQDDAFGTAVATNTAFDCYEWDATQFPTVLAPGDNPAYGSQCGAVGSQRWFLGESYTSGVNSYNDMQCLPAANGVLCTRSAFAWNIATDGVSATTLANMSVIVGTCENYDLATPGGPFDGGTNGRGDLDAWMFQYGPITQNPGGGYQFSDVDFGPGVDGWHMPSDGTGAYYVSVGDYDEASNTWTYDVAQNMLWGTYSAAQGSQDSTQMDDDNPADTTWDPVNEFYDYAFGVCPDPLGVMACFLYESAQPVTLAPSSFTVGLGSVISGDVNSLASDDANALKLCKAFVPNQTSPRIRFDADFTSPYLTPSSIQLDLKARMTTGGAFKVRAFLADVSGTDSFVYGAANQVIADTLINLTFASYSSGSMAPGTHVDTDADTTADGTVRARVEIQQTGFSAVAVPCSEFELLNLTVNP